MRLINDLAALLACDPDEQSVLACRAALPPDQYSRTLLGACNFRMLLVDTGYAAPDGYQLTELAALAGCPARQILRLETALEALIQVTTTLAELEERFRHELRSARDQGIIAFKSIAAYRGGLQIGPPDATVAAERLRDLMQTLGPLRLSDPALVAYFLHVALEEAARLELPIQFHVAFGDDDVDLRTASPLQLRSLLRTPAYRRVPFVLLHCYPYIREAGYLASIYSNVYVDLSLTVPLAAHGSSTAFAQVLELAPVSKVLFGTDAHTVPELFFAGARHGRQALAQVLTRLVHTALIRPAQADLAAEAILWRNALTLYQL